MMNTKTDMRVSIVIPVYNEAQHLRACLEAVEHQSVKPYEVIVVDNNSSDETCAIAEAFPFVRVITEARQGVVYARNTGFDATRGGIIGRIDADTIIPNDWVATLQSLFVDETIGALSGSVHYYDIVLSKWSGACDLFFRERLARRLGSEVFLYGANMGIRRSAWERARTEVCSSAGLHEDFDLGIHLEEMGQNVVFDKKLHAGVSLRRFETGIYQFWRYALISPRTYARHGRTSQRAMYSVIAVAMAAYGFFWFNHHCYDPETTHISFRRVLFSTTDPRVNPATFVE